MDAGNGNYYLKAGSPCIDSGTSSDAPSQDKAGIARPQGAGMDMGIYEYVDPNSCTPRASFSTDQTTGIDTLTVWFDASSSSGSMYEGAVLSWDFGDGSTANGIEVSHTYTSYGSFDVSLTVRTACGSHTITHPDLIKINSSLVTKQVSDGHPFSSIQQAINEAEYGEIILVHDGIYLENINFQGKSLILRSANGPDTTIIDGNGAENVVTFNHQETEDTVLDGFTIQNGSQVGIYCASFVSPTIINCHIKENIDGGIHCIFASPIIMSCIINSSSTGIYCYYSSPTITNCTIIKNSGSGVYCLYSTLNLHNSLISQNNNGGIRSNNNSLLDISDCIIRENSTRSGGGIHCSYSSFNLTNCLIVKNYALQWGRGGGISIDQGSSGTLTNCTISKNEASDKGGAAYCIRSSTIFKFVFFGGTHPMSFIPMKPILSLFIPMFKGDVRGGRQSGCKSYFC